MTKTAISGLAFIGVGVLIVLFALINVYFVFTQKAEVPAFFNLPGISFDLSNLVGSDLPSDQVAQLRAAKNLKTDLISPDIINAPLNLFVYLLFMGFFANAGIKIASLGVQFIRPIKVNLREESHRLGEPLARREGDKNGQS
jgi:hypothetical protein